MSTTGYLEIESSKPDQIRLLCACGNVLKKRRDSFLTGSHVAHCLACHNVSSEVTVLSGDADHRSGSA